MPDPEGYRKTYRLFQLAERFKRLLSSSGPPGAYPGIGAEEHPVQAETITKFETSCYSSKHRHYCHYWRRRVRRCAGISVGDPYFNA